MSIQYYYLRLLMTILCTICLMHLTLIGPCLAEVSDSAKPNAKESKDPSPDSGEEAPQPAKASDSSAKATPTPESNGQDAPIKTQAMTDDSPPPSNNSKKGISREVKPDATNEFLSRFSPSISNFYSRSVADFQTSDFGHTLGFWAAVDFQAMSSLTLSTRLGVYNELGEEYERFVASNWFLGATRTVKLPLGSMLYPRVYFRLPTNPDANEYLTYRGTVGSSVEWRKFNFYRFHKDHTIGGALSLGAERSMYETAFNRGGGPNTLWQMTGSATLSYRFKGSFLLISQYRNFWRWGPEGARADDLYRLSTSINYNPIKQIWLALSLVSQDRTFLYDQVTSNVSFYAAESTSVVFSLTYLPRISIVNELSR